jgi:hypothetical protein
MMQQGQGRWGQNLKEEEEEEEEAEEEEADKWLCKKSKLGRMVQLVTMRCARITTRQ